MLSPRRRAREAVAAANSCCSDERNSDANSVGFQVGVGWRCQVSKTKTRRSSRRTPTLPLPLALPTLDLLPRLSGLLGPMEEAAVAAVATRREGNIDRSSQVDESPAKGDKGAIAL